MSLPLSVEALRNERTGKLFVVIDWDVGEGRAKVINPNGDILDVAKVIFKLDEPVRLGASDYTTQLSESQVKKLESFEKEQFASSERKRLDKAVKSSKPASAKSSSRSPTTRAKKAPSARKEGLIESKSTSGGRRPAAQWNADTLVFFKHRIDALKANDVFAVSIEGHGTLQMTKAEFQRTFNNVIMDQNYRVNGQFKYAEIPEVALPFIK